MFFNLQVTFLIGHYLGSHVFDLAAFEDLAVIKYGFDSLHCKCFSSSVLLDKV